MKKFYWKDYLMALPIIILFLVTTKFSVINAESYNSINNKVDFSSDVICQIITDRFYDGDSTNNPSGLLKKSKWRSYLGEWFEPCFEYINNCRYIYSKLAKIDSILVRRFSK